MTRAGWVGVTLALVVVGAVVGVVVYQVLAAGRSRWSLLKSAPLLEVGELRGLVWAMGVPGALTLLLALLAAGFSSWWAALAAGVLAADGTYFLCRAVAFARAASALSAGRSPWPLPPGGVFWGTEVFLNVSEYWYGVCRSCRGLCGPLGDSEEPASTALARLASSGWDTGAGLCPRCRQAGGAR